MEGAETKRFQGLEGALFALLTAAYAAPFFLFDYFPSQDGPAHLYNALALHDYFVFPDGASRLYYELNDTPIANWATHSVMAFLIHFVPILVAEKILLIAYVFFFAFSFRYALGVLGVEGRSFAVLAFPLMGGWALHMGFYNFSYSIPFFVLTLALFLDPKEVERTRFALKVAVVATALCLVHSFTFVVAACSAISLAIWHAIWSLREKRNSECIESELEFTKGAIARDFWARVIGWVPGFAILLPWILAGGRSPRLNWIDFAQRWDAFSRLSVLAVYFESEHFWSKAFLIMVAALLAIAFMRRMREFSLRRSDGLLILALGLIAVYFISPDWAFGVGRLNYRLLLFPFFPLILWFGAQAWPTSMRVGAQVAGTIISLVLLSYHVAAYAELDEYFDDYLSVADEVEPGRSILPLTVSWTSPRLQSQRMVDQIWPFLHASGYLSAVSGGVYLNNYEALLGTFPLRFRPEMNPNEYIGHVGNVPPDVEFEGYAKRTPGDVDYVVRWELSPRPEESYTDLREYERIIDSWSTQLDNGYERVRVSPSGSMELWRRVGAEER
jgi:hypothetical protein